jgi:hypothetical protein
MSDSISEVSATLKRVDFGLVRVPSWPARILGIGRRPARQFIEQWHDVVAAESRLQANAKAYAHQHKARTAAVEGDSRQLDAESHRVAQCLSEASQCLASLSQALSREKYPDPALKAFEVRSVASIEKLRPVNAAMLRMPSALRTVTNEGTSLIELLQKDWTPAFNRWRASMKVLEDRIEGLGYSDESPEWQLRMHDKLQKLLLDIQALCAQLEEHEDDVEVRLGKLSGRA